MGKVIHVPVSDELHQKVKLLAVSKNVSMKDFIIGVFESLDNPSFNKKVKR